MINELLQFNVPGNPYLVCPKLIMVKSVIAALVPKRRLWRLPYHTGGKLHEHANQIQVQTLYYIH